MAAPAHNALAGTDEQRRRKHDGHRFEVLTALTPPVQLASPQEVGRSPATDRRAAGEQLGHVVQPLHRLQRQRFAVRWARRARDPPQGPAPARSGQLARSHAEGEGIPGQQAGRCDGRDASHRARFGLGHRPDRPALGVCAQPTLLGRLWTRTPRPGLKRSAT